MKSVAKREVKRPQTPYWCGFALPFKLLPLYRRGWFGREVIAHAVDAFHLLQNTVGDLQKYRPFDLFYSCFHSVHGVDGADDDWVFKATGVVAYADRLEIGDNGKVLPNGFIQSGLLELLTQDCVGFPDGFQAIAVGKPCRREDPIPARRRAPRL